MDVGTDRAERGVGGGPFVDAYRVGVKQPRHGGVAGPCSLELLRWEERAETAEGHAVEGVDSVEQLEHLRPQGLVKRFNVADEIFEPLEQLIEFSHEGEGTPVAGEPRSPSRILIGCVGNVLRRDDGFGPAVAARLGDLPSGVEVVESGIGGIALLQEIMAGCDGLVVVDAVERGAEPGTVFVVEPDVAAYDQVPDMHLATPDRVLSMAQGLGCLPGRVLIVGCQPLDAEDMGMELSPAVARAVDEAAAQVRETVATWLADCSPADSAAIGSRP